jgi:hypothetical protein
MSNLPVHVGDDLTVTIGNASTRLTPSLAFDLGEELLRRGMRRAIAEEAMNLRPVRQPQKVEP